MKKGIVYLVGILVVAMLVVPVSVHGARLKDIASFNGIRTNQLVGYGLVVGLNGTGDSSNTEFTIRSIVNLLERMGIHVERDRITQVKLKNVAAVMVTASIPPFSRIGNKIDVLLSSVGDAKSLLGGTLLITPLTGVDQQVYALAAGSVVTGGFAVSGASGGGVQKNHPTVGLISKGATVEKEIHVNLDIKRELILSLFNPDFTTAERVKETINRSLNGPYAKSEDSGTIKIRVPEYYQGNVAEWIASVEKLEVTPDGVAKVILNERTGTVVLGENVRISTVAVGHGNLSIQIKERLNVSQPLPFAPSPPPESSTTVVPPGAGTGAIVAPGGSTVVTPESSINVKEDGTALIVLPSGADLGEVVRALNAIGVTQRDLISILQSIKAAGALQADLEII